MIWNSNWTLIFFALYVIDVIDLRKLGLGFPRFQNLHLQGPGKLKTQKWGDLHHGLTILKVAQTSQ